MQVIDYDLFRLLDSFQAARYRQISNFKFLNLSLSLCRTKDKVKRKERGKRNDESNCFICFLRGKLLGSKAKTRGITLKFRKFFENSYTVDTHHNILRKRTIIFVKHLN